MARVTSVRARTPRRRPRAVLLLLVSVLLVLEIATVVAVARVIGPWPTVILLLLGSAFGAWLVRRGGGRAWGALVATLDTGRMPGRELSDATLILVGGVLVLIPGFLTDIVGFFIVAPPTRPVARRVLESLVARRLLAGAAPQAWDGPGGPMGPPGAGTTVRGDVID